MSSSERFFLRRRDGATLPVGKILCVGRNDPAHVREMGGDPLDRPVFFLKPTTALVESGGIVVLPKGIGRVDHEIEVAMILGERVRRGGSAERARSSLWGCALFLDITARDLQRLSKSRGEPWTISKGIDTFAPLGVADTADPDEVELLLRVAGEVRQRGSTRDLRWGSEKVLEEILRFMTLEPGDVVALGTVGGVGPLRPGDSLEGRGFLPDGRELPPLEVRVEEE